VIFVIDDVEWNCLVSEDKCEIDEVVVIELC